MEEGLESNSGFLVRDTVNPFSSVSAPPIDRIFNQDQTSSCHKERSDPVPLGNTDPVVRRQCCDDRGPWIEPNQDLLTGSVLLRPILLVVLISRILNQSGFL